MWFRAPFGISTCDNHAERFHRAINQDCDTRKRFPKRLHELAKAITAKYEKYARDPRRQATEQFERLKKSGSHKE
jgi:hypothetical protein